MGFGPPSPMSVMAQGEGGEFFNLNLVVSRTAGVAGQGDVFPLAETNRQSQTLRQPGCCFCTQM